MEGEQTVEKIRAGEVKFRKVKVLTTNSEVKKYNEYEVNQLIADWADKWNVPAMRTELLLSMKKTAKPNSDFTLSELKQLVNDEIKDIKNIRKEREIEKKKSDLAIYFDLYHQIRKKLDGQYTVTEYLKLRRYPENLTQEQREIAGKEQELLRALENGLIKDDKPKIKNPYQKVDYLDFNNLKFKVIQLIALKQRADATELIVQYIRNHYYLYTIKEDESDEIWIYRDGIYVPNGKSEIKEIVRNLLQEVFTINFCNEVIAKVEADTYIEKSEFFNKNYLDEMPVENGILNLRTKSLSPFDPQKLFFNKIPIKFDLQAKCDDITNHFKTVLSDESDVKVMFELCGYCLYKDYFIEKAFMFVGNGRNGKSKTLELIKRFLAPENCASLSLSNLNTVSFDVEDLFGKFVNLSGDLSKTDLKETGTFKGLTGRDFIFAKRKFKSGIKFVNFAKLCFACNELPRVYDSSEGFWSRWLLLEFPYKFVSQEEYNKLPEKEKEKHKIKNTDIINQISSPEQLSGLLNESLEGLHRLFNNKEFSGSKGTQQIKDFWIRKSDSFMAFCLDCLESDYDNIVTKKELRKTFNNYCKKFKVIGSSDKNMKVVLEEMFGATEDKKMLEGSQEHCWIGIKFNNKSKEFKPKLFENERI